MLGWVNLHELCVEVEAALGPFGGMEGVPKGSRWVGFLVSNICSAPLPSPVSASAGSGREESGVRGFPSRRGLTPRGSLECNPVQLL